MADLFELSDLESAIGASVSRKKTGDAEDEFFEFKPKTSRGVHGAGSGLAR